MNPILQDQVDNLLVKKGVAITPELEAFFTAVDEAYIHCDEDRQAFMDSAKILADAQSIANMGNWSVDLKANKITWSDELFRIFEMDKDTFTPSFEAFLDFVHPDDKERVLKLWKKTQAGSFTDNTEYRIILKSGQIKWVQVRSNHSSIENFPNDQKIIGTLQDITDHKIIEEAMNDANERLHLLFDNAPNGYLLIDRNGLVISVNKAMEEMTMMIREEMIGKKITDLGIIKDQSVITGIINSLNDHNELFKQEFELFRKNETSIYIDNRNSPFEIQGEKVVLSMFSDISARHETEEETATKAKNLERTNKIMVNRELKMIELKKENIELRRQLESIKKDGH